MWPPICTTHTATGSYLSILAFRSARLMQRSSLLQSTNSTLPPAFITLKGVAIKVFDGQRTVFPFTLKNSHPASAAPPQLEKANASKLRYLLHFSSNSWVNLPSDHLWVSMISSHILCSLPRSSFSKPIVNFIHPS